jgi:hypothetical protein
METIVLLDTVYIWNTVENPNLWKIGVSNHYKVENRIKKVSNSGSLTPYITKYKVFENENVLKIEKELLSIGEPYIFENTFDGHSEFRLLTEEQEQYMYDILAEESYI